MKILDYLIINAKLIITLYINKTLMKDKNRYTTISIPIQLNEKLKGKIEGTGFHSVSSYVIYVLRQLVSSTDAADKGFTNQDEKKVKDRLKRLGYL